MREVPEKTIACIPVLPDEGYAEFDMDFSKFFRPLNKNHKRDWFTPHFYKCLPLSIGNMQGFVFSVPFDFTVMWNGGAGTDDVKIFDINTEGIPDHMNYVSVSSEFGHGIFTVHFPMILKTPPGVNLMTIAPPNFPMAGLSPMTGVVETDNLRFTFTLNFKIDLINVPITVPRDYPIMGLLPIPRYFCDSFEMVNAYDILDKDYVEQERAIAYEHSQRRAIQNAAYENAEGSYFKGMDIKGNKFKDHQLPTKTKFVTNSGPKVRRKREE